MIATLPRRTMEVLFFGVTVFLVLSVVGAGVVGEQYANKIYLDENCNDSLTTDGHPGGEILLTRGKGCAAQKCACSLTFNHNVTDRRLKIRFQNLNLGQDSNKLCNGGTIQVWSVNGGNKAQKTDTMCTDPQFSGSTVEADMNTLFFDWKLGPAKDPVSTMFWTVFHEDNCTKTEFECTNYQCVSNDLKCDGYDNCGDKSDEDKDTAKCAAAKTISSAYLSVITLAAILFRKLL